MERRQWLLLLGARCAPTTTDVHEAKAKVASYVTGLSDIPQAAFCEASVEAASRKFEFFPAYAPLRAFLEGWLAEWRAQAAPPLPGDDSLTDEDRQHLASWERLRPERVANGNLGIALSVQRSRPELFRYICRTDAEADRIARARGWLAGGPQVEQRVHDDWAAITPEGIAAKLIELDKLHHTGKIGPAMAAGWLSFLRSAVAKHAPHHAHLIPDRFEREERERRRSVDEQVAAVVGTVVSEEVAKATAAFVAKHGRKPGELSPEQLAAMRAAQGGPKVPPKSPPAG